MSVWERLQQKENLQTAFADMRMWIGTHTVLLLAALFVLSVVISIVCYRKGEGIVGQYLNSNDDEQQEELDRQYDFWGNIGMTGSKVLLYLSIAIFALWTVGGKGKRRRSADFDWGSILPVGRCSLRNVSGGNREADSEERSDEAWGRCGSSFSKGVDQKL